MSKINYIENYDVAVFSARSENNAPPFPGRLGIDLKIPIAGEEVALLAHKLCFHETAEGGVLDQNLIFWLGTVSESTEPVDRKNQKFSFETTVPIPAGLSGAPIVRMSNVGEDMHVCGIASFDVSPENSFSNFLIAGRSRGATLWPSAGLGFEMNVDDRGSSMTVLGSLMAGKYLTIAQNGVEITVENEGGKQLVKYRDVTNDQTVVLEMPIQDSSPKEKA